MTDIVPILVVVIIAVTFGAGLLTLVSFLGPKVKASKLKLESYECGIEGQSSGHSKVPVKFYLTAILFILFDIEIIFMYPWAIAYREFLSQGEGLYILVSMAIFILIFIFGLFWEIKSKALEWD